MPTFGSLFSGVGGIDLGLERAGWECRWQVELDDFRRGILARHWPGVPRQTDVRLVGGGLVERGRRCATSSATGRDAAEHRLAPVDLICGGFPCQDVSVAGRRAGLAGERSGLFFEFARIAETLRPAHILIENVPGLLTSHRGRDFGLVLQTLAELGYGVAWRILDSRFFGVPQRRRRVFIVGALPGGRAGAERAGEILAVGESCQRHPAKGGAPRTGVAGTLEGGAADRGWRVGADEAGGAISLSGLGNGGPDDNDAQAGRLAYSLGQNDRNRSQGPANYVAALTTGGNQQDDQQSQQLVTHSLTSEGHDASEDGTGRGTPLIAYPLARRGREEGAEWELGEEPVSNALRVGDGGSSRASHGAVYRKARRAGENDPSPESWDEADVATTLDATANGTRTANAVLGAGVRRLTTTECLRLQAFPDDWLGEPNEPPDSPRYAAMGDAVTVNIAEWIGWCLMAVAEGQSARREARP